MARHPVMAFKLAIPLLKWARSPRLQLGWCCSSNAESVVARAPDSEDAPSEGDYIVCFFSRNDGSAAVGIVCFCESNYTCVCFFVLLVLRWSLREVGCAFQRME